MTAVATPDAARLVIAAVIGLILLLVLIIKFKVQAMISILVGAVAIGLMAGMSLSDIVSSVNEGIGNTLKGIALLVGLGSMFGAILEESGGAQTLAVTMVRKFGDQKAAWALGITGLVIAMPVFFDAGLIILIPLAFSLAKRTNWQSAPIARSCTMRFLCWLVWQSVTRSFLLHRAPCWWLRCWVLISAGSFSSAFSAVSLQ